LEDDVITVTSSVQELPVCLFCYTE